MTACQKDLFVYLLFSRKYHCSQDHILSKKRPFSEKQIVLIFPYLVKKLPKRLWKTNSSHISHILAKNVPSLKNTVILCHFNKNFHVKAPAGMPIFVQKLQFCQNYAILWSRKKSTFGGVEGGLEHLWQLLW